MKELDKSTKDRLAFLERNYEPLEILHLNGDTKVYLGDADNKRCRFCGRKEGETTFATIAHALPEFIGNKRLLANYECDDCNNKFSSLLETHMAAYMQLWHALAQVKGKKGIPSFVNRKQKSRIDLGKENVEVKDSVDDTMVQINEEKKTITFSGTRPSYVPIAIYKCLVKMALTIMPEEELKFFEKTLQWIQEPNHEGSLFHLKQLTALLSIAPGPHPFPFVSASLFKRKTTAVEDVPYTIFLVAYANFVFQIYIPLCSADAKLVGKMLHMVYIPTPIDMMEGTNLLLRKQLDFTDKKMRKGEVENVVMQYESMEENDLSDPKG